MAERQRAGIDGQNNIIVQIEGDNAVDLKGLAHLTSPRYADLAISWFSMGATVGALAAALRGTASQGSVGKGLLTLTG
jgi:hypothetical protein